MTETLSNFSHQSAAASNDERPHHIYDAERYSETRFVPFPKGFIRLTNPRDCVQTALVHLGPPPGTAPPTYLPNFSDDPDAEPTERQLRAARARSERECCKITFQPGESMMIPRELVRGLVTVRDGIVVGGLLPFLVIEGDPSPPALGPALLDSAPADPFMCRAPIAPIAPITAIATKGKTRD